MDLVGLAGLLAGRADRMGGLVVVNGCQACESEYFVMDLDDCTDPELCRCCLGRGCSAESTHGVIDDLNDPDDTGEIYCEAHAEAELHRRMLTGERHVAILVLPTPRER